MSDPDDLTKTRTIYDVGTGELIWRNFLAGMSRAVGGLVVYLIVVFILGNLFLTYVWPVFQPQFESFQDLTKTLENTNSTLKQAPFGL